MEINNFTIGCGVCYEPEVRYVGEKKTPLLTLSVVNKTDRSTSYFTVEIWGQKAEDAAGQIKKGTQLLLSGSIKQDRWEKDGVKGNKVKLVAEQIQVLPSTYQQQECSEEDTPF